MKILVSGSHGLIGSSLCERLEQESHEVWRLTRSKSDKAREIYWQPETRIIENNKMEGFDAAIHLGGVNIAERRWTKAFKQELSSSRIQSTSFLAETLASLALPPQTFICASAVGYYGERGDEILNENSAPGRGFLPTMAQQWEASCSPVLNTNIRLVHARFGIVLDRKGGALSKMLPIFKIGLGGKLGNGRHYMSWISLEDAINALIFMLYKPTLHGAVNITAPNPVTNLEFTKTLAKAIRRPALLPAPRIALRLAFGEMVDEALFCSTKAIPQKLIEHEFKFLDANLESALKRIL